MPTSIPVIIDFTNQNNKELIEEKDMKNKSNLKWVVGVLVLVAVVYGVLQITKKPELNFREEGARVERAD